MKCCLVTLQELLVTWTIILKWKQNSDILFYSILFYSKLLLSHFPLSISKKKLHQPYILLNY